MSFFDGVDSFLRGASDWVSTSKALTDLETTDDARTFATRDGALMSLIRVRGTMTLIGADEFKLQTDSLHTEWASRMSKSGHSLVVYYAFDPRKHSAAERCVNDMRATARQIGLDLDDVMDEYNVVLSRLTQDEDIFLAVYTRLNALPKATQNTQKKQTARQKKENFRMAPDTQSVESVSAELRDDHYAFVQGTLAVMAGPQCQIAAEVVPCREALHIMRSSLFPSETGKDWKAILPGDRIPLRYKDNGRDVSAEEVLYPALHKQIFKSNLVFEDARTIKIDKVYARAIALSLPPQQPQPFAALFDRLLNADFVWRVAFHIDSDGLGLLGWKGLLSSILFFASSANRQINAAKEDLKQQVEQGGRVDVRFRMMAAVFSESKKDLDRAAAQMSSAIQGWGTADTEIPMGSAVPRSVICTIPGLFSRSTAPNAAAPFDEIIPMLPWTRPASVWDTGMPFRSADGRVLPFQQGSSKQTSFIDLGTGPMGYGKSVALNAYNLAFLLAPGLSRLPWLSILDVGPSSSGLVLLVKDALPPEKRHLAIYERLRMDPERYAINPFDLPLGCRKPMASKVFNLVGLLSLLNTPYDKEAPGEDVPGLARAIIEKAYDDFSDDQNPKRYAPHSAPNNPDVVHLDQMVEKYGMHMDKYTTWFNVADFFFEKGLVREAGIAHRYAMPLLKEVAALTKSESVTRVYGVDACDKFWKRCLEAENAYPILRVPTRFTLGEAQIVSLDIDEIAPKGTPVADRQTAVMYLVVSEILSGRFFVMPEDVKFMPPLYQTYHTTRIERIRNDPKRLVFDELHRVGKNSSVSAKVVRDLETAARESRKWNLHIGLYSQDPGDFPSVMAGFASTVFIFGVGTAKVAAEAGQIFSLSEAAVQICVRRLKKPGRLGSTVVAKFSTDSGTITQFLMVSLGSRTLWALASTTEDTYVRGKLYLKLTPRIARDVLSKVYPGGSIKELYEQIRLLMLNHEPMGGDFDELYALMQAEMGVGEVVDARDLIVRQVLKVHQDQERIRMKGEN